MAVRYYRKGVRTGGGGGLPVSKPQTETPTGYLRIRRAPAGVGCS